MKLLLTAAITACTLALATAPAVGRPYGDPPGQEKCDKPLKLEKDLRKLASELCVAAVASGAYADLNDDALSTFCMDLAEHLLKDPFDHIAE